MYIVLRWTWVHVTLTDPPIQDHHSINTYFGVLFSVCGCTLPDSSNAPRGASHGAPPSASGAGHLAHSHPLQSRPLTCTPPASHVHFNLSGGPHTGYARPGHVHSQMMAMRELKLPMLKHSRATSMKNSITCALCFFLAGWGEDTRASVGVCSSPFKHPNQPACLSCSSQSPFHSWEAQGPGFQDPS